MINEFMASNTTIDIPGYSKNDDWIELYNPTNSSIDISGYYITDDINSPTKFRLPSSAGSLVIPAKGYVVLICSDNPGLGKNHITLGLSVSGEEIGVYSPDGSTLVDYVQFDAQRSDVSMGRNPGNLSQWKFFKKPTPGLLNSSNEMFDMILPPPTFSHNGGIYTSPFNLHLTTDVPGAVIYYTLDGSEPDINNVGGKTFLYKNTSYGSLLTEYMHTFQYNNFINIIDRSTEPNKVSLKSSSWGAWSTNWYFPNNKISKGTVVKAMIVKPGGLPEVLTNTYFVFSNGTSRYSLPIVSLSMDESKMFDYWTGFYTPGIHGSGDNTYAGNYAQDFRPFGNMEYFVNNEQVINRYAEFKIQGASSKISPKKSLRVYSDDSFNYPFYEKFPDRIHKNIILRGVGSGNPGNWYVNVFKDAVNQTVATGLNFGKQENKPSLVFINGEYWGTHSITERIDKHYINQVFGVNKDSIDLLKVENFFHTEEGSVSNYDNLETYLHANDLRNASVYNRSTELVDILSLIDYFSFNFFIANNDWPHNNVRLWRKRLLNNRMGTGFNDGRWRWLLFDTDESLNDYSFHALGSKLEMTGEQERYVYVLKKFLTNASFKSQFISRFLDLLNSNFKAVQTESVITNLKSVYDKEIIENAERWSDPSSNVWETEVSNIKDFYSRRPPIQRSQLRSYFNQGAERNLTVNVTDDALGYVRVNTIDIVPSTPGVSEAPTPWTGVYFQGLPIVLEAKSYKGGRFKHWLKGSSIISSNTKITVNLTANENYTAVFEESILSNNPYPVAKHLDKCGFKFTEWSSSAATGTHPTNMSFVYFNAVNDRNEPDHVLKDTLGGRTYGSFGLGNRSRINGLGELGVSFINTGGPQEHEGYPYGKLGGLLLALNTSGQDSIYVSWTGGTVLPNSRDYAIRLQYRRGDKLDFKDLLDSKGNPIEYVRNEGAGHSHVFEKIKLPDELSDQPYIQLLWNYYHKGSVNSGSRPQLRLDDIIITTQATYDRETHQSSLVSSNSSIRSAATIGTGGLVEYNASNYVLLEPGFNTSASAVFKAEINKCLN
jgi:hypothetical protein